MSAPLRWARLTAGGAAGVAVFRVAGDGARVLLASSFRPRRPGALVRDDLRFGALTIGGDEDDVVVRVGGNALDFRADVAIHGSVYLAAALETVLGRAGAHDVDLASPRSDPLVAEAYEGLECAFAEAQVTFFLHAASGALSDGVASMASSLAAAEPMLDAIAERVDALLRRAPFGLAVATPPVVAIAGAPNAGKSTLFNALLGEDRTLVSPEPGTTRDVVSERAVFRGHAFRLSDSAGIRSTTDAVETLGVARAEAAARSADIVLLVIDPQGDLEAQMRLAGCEGGRRVVVLSKSDLPDAARARDRLAAMSPRLLCVAPRTGDGLESVRDAIVSTSPFGGPGDLLQPAPFLDRHVALLQTCRNAIDGGAATDARSALMRLCRREA